MHMILLDSEAILDYLHGEGDVEAIGRALLEGAAISAFSYGLVLDSLMEHVSLEEAASDLADLGLLVLDFDAEMAFAGLTVAGSIEDKVLAGTAAVKGLQLWGRQVS
jgi:predicted nucleic acid-binding protein